MKIQAIPNYNLHLFENVDLKLLGDNQKTKGYDVLSTKFASDAIRTARQAEIHFGSTLETSKESNKVTHISSDDFDNIKKAYMEGQTFENIAKSFNCSIYTVYSYVRRQPYWMEMRETHNNKVMAGKKGRTPYINADDIVEIRKYYEKGQSLKEIGKQKGCSAVTILTYLKKQPDLEDIRIKHNRAANYLSAPFSSYDEDFISKAYIEGQSLKEIANQVGCNETIILKYVQKHPDLKAKRKEHIRLETAHNKG